MLLCLGPALKKGAESKKFGSLSFLMVISEISGDFVFYRACSVAQTSSLLGPSRW